MSKLDVAFRVSYEDYKNGQIWLREYRSAEGSSGQVNHAFTWTENKKSAKKYRYNRAKQIALYFLDAMLDYGGKSTSEFTIKVIGPDVNEEIEE